MLHTPAGLDLLHFRSHAFALGPVASAADKAASRENKQIDKLIGDVEGAAKQGIDYVDTVVLAGAQLLAKIKLQRTKLA
ncbi:MAG: hypothetical protein JWP52_2815 [Rhizobacter sp.]|nr:hypothetical protein [Rhizobacter sp.]